MKNIACISANLNQYSDTLKPVFDLFDGFPRFDGRACISCEGTLEHGARLFSVVNRWGFGNKIPRKAQQQRINSFKRERESDVQSGNLRKDKGLLARRAQEGMSK